MPQIWSRLRMNHHDFTQFDNSHDFTQFDEPKIPLTVDGRNAKFSAIFFALSHLTRNFHGFLPVL